MEESGECQQYETRGETVNADCSSALQTEEQFKLGVHETTIFCYA